jgi:hypothetical protein
VTRATCVVLLVLAGCGGTEETLGTNPAPAQIARCRTQFVAWNDQEGRPTVLGPADDLRPAEPGLQVQLATRVIDDAGQAGQPVLIADGVAYDCDLRGHAVVTFHGPKTEFLVRAVTDGAPCQEDAFLVTINW